MRTKYFFSEIAISFEGEVFRQSHWSWTGRLLQHCQRSGSNRKLLSLGPSVVEKVVDSWYWYNLADAKLGIGYPIQLVADIIVSIELLEYRLAEIISRCKQVADAVNVSRGNRCYKRNWLIPRLIPQFGRVANPQKVEKNKQNWNQHELATLQTDELAKELANSSANVGFLN
jgi:hypothetical protein